MRPRWPSWNARRSIPPRRLPPAERGRLPQVPDPRSDHHPDSVRVCRQEACHAHRGCGSRPVQRALPARELLRGCVDRGCTDIKAGEELLSHIQTPPIAPRLRQRRVSPAIATAGDGSRDRPSGAACTHLVCGSEVREGGGGRTQPLLRLLRPTDYPELGSAPPESEHPFDLADACLLTSSSLTPLRRSRPTWLEWRIGSIPRALVPNAGGQLK